MPRTRSLVALAALTLLSAGLAPGAAAASCTYLPAVGGGTSVSKSIQLNGPLVFPFGRTNFNTDFTVNRAFSSYKVNFKSNSSERGPYPIQAYLKFSDGTNLQVVNETLDARPGQFRQFGPFYPPSGKLVSQVNVKVGSGYNANATGFSYTISVFGCR
ncbi:hypothetical protein VB734_14330 [Synechococcus sp. BA-124 BA4]|jgi:hypothetical protein|uniref:hypothetical protein n=1 Tax=unclassified Synechococcus TaxID=2626047 RepID=UPI0018CF7EC6|nr:MULTISPECIES: hypothetical protein [unclassified Synechococcus]MEA5401215.1 hypothetical protein [Synechococcus sp. BA-124 BA4]QPN56293.1 hypothetical protein I1E95_14550 [Synechococcus sp. CBW1107]CAK6698198.1 hypothetical protein BBFGKLBO_02406 [Synechococcus sp. CBW1107]